MSENKNAKTPTDDGQVAHVYLFDKTGRPMVAWDNAKDIKLGDKLYAAPKQWVGLTADEIWKCNKAKSGSAVEFHICYAHQNVEDFAEAIEAKLKEKKSMSTCPPCNQKCNQGRDCPANKQGHAEAMKRALTALEIIERFLDPLAKWQVRKPKDGGPMITVYPQKVAEEAINDLREVIAYSERQEPFCYHDGVNQVDAEFKDHSDVFPLYLAAPQREWVGLTDQEINSVCYKRDWTAPWTSTTFARAIEAKLREKNGGEYRNGATTERTKLNQENT